MISQHDLLETYTDTAIIAGNMKGMFIEFAHLMEYDRAFNVVAFTGKRSLEENDIWKTFLRSTRLSYFNFSRFSDIDPEPTVETVEKMVEFMKDVEPQGVVAIGGGSVIDAAKAAYLVYQTGADIHDFFGVNKYSEQNPDKPLKRITCFPTTAGTGSEVTPYSCIVDKKTGVKKLICDEQIIPSFSFLAPEMTLSLPEGVTRSTALDALAHSIEGLLNIGHDGNCDDANNWALASIKLVVENLESVLEDGSNLGGRDALMAAACLGGMVIRYKSTGLPHLCSFSWFGKMAHGSAVATLLPYAWAYYIEDEAVRERTLQLKEIFGVEEDSAEAVIQAYCEFVKRCGLELALKNVDGISEELLDTTAKSAGENKMKLEQAPRPVPVEKSYDVLSGILNNAWNGKI